MLNAIQSAKKARLAARAVPFADPRRHAILLARLRARDYTIRAQAPAQEEKPELLPLEAILGLPMEVDWRRISLRSTERPTNGDYKMNTNNTFTYGDLEIDATKLSPVGVDALIRRGISHLLGNEVSSKINKEGAWFKGFVEAQKREPSADEVASAQLEFRKAAIAALYDGTIGTRVGGPRVDPVTAEMATIAKREITDILKTQGIKKFPTGENTVTLGADKLTGEQLVARRLTKYGDRIRKEAEKTIAERARKAKAAQAAAQAVQNVSDADALGL